MTKASHRFFSNRDCQYFPCHAGDPEHFNCLFCYCPLYCIPKCGGKPRYLKNGIKDCSACLRPHQPEEYNAILSTLRQHMADANEKSAGPPTPIGEASPRA